MLAAALVPASLRATTEIRYSRPPTRPVSTTGPAATLMVPLPPGRSLVQVTSYDDARATGAQLTVSRSGPAVATTAVGAPAGGASGSTGAVGTTRTTLE